MAADRELVDKGDTTDFFTVDDAAYGAAYAYRNQAASLDTEGDSTLAGIPEIGAGLYGSSPGHYSFGPLLWGKYDDSGRPTVDITQTNDLAGVWHAHPKGSDWGELKGHIQNLQDAHWLNRIYTSVGRALRVYNG